MVYFIFSFVTVTLLRSFENFRL